MAYTLIEKYESGDGETGMSPRGEFVYYVASTNGTDDTDTFGPVAAFAIANIPAVDPQFNQQVRLSWKRAAPGVWEFYANYQSEGQFRLTNEHQITFNTAGGTSHITQARSHVQTYNAAGTTPALDNGALGIDDEGNANGIDIDVAGFNFQTVLYLALGTVDDTYVALFEGAHRLRERSDIHSGDGQYQLYLRCWRMPTSSRAGLSASLW